LFTRVAAYGAVCGQAARGAYQVPGCVRAAYFALVAALAVATLLARVASLTTLAAIIWVEPYIGAFFYGQDARNMAAFERLGAALLVAADPRDFAACVAAAKQGRRTAERTALIKAHVSWAAAPPTEALAFLPRLIAFEMLLAKLVAVFWFLVVRLGLVSPTQRGQDSAPEKTTETP
jgi:hypothetical protein